MVTTRYVGLFVACMFAISLVSSACVDEYDTILKLYSEENSHAALHNSTYSVDICYSDFFDYPGFNSSVHEPIGKNPLFWLYSWTNSHISFYGESSYTVPVYYNELTCELDFSAGETCTNQNMTAIVDVSSTTNAHVSVASSDAYLGKVCCMPLSVIDDDDDNETDPDDDDDDNDGNGNDDNSKKDDKNDEGPIIITQSGPFLTGENSSMPIIISEPSGEVTQGWFGSLEFFLLLAILVLIALIGILLLATSRYA